MKFLNLKFIPQSADLALLIVRVLAGFTLIYAHGWKKLAHFNDTVAQWTQWGLNPIGVGPTASVALSGFAEVVCAALLILGLKARFAALVIGINLTVAFVAVHKAALTGDNNGELAFMYLLAAVLVLFAGPGKFSVDGRG
ncbi:hypothetical protein AXK12_03560 [Cephaloticoccus capnophilus]|uniref:DoxX family protein n=1 Tax=Cephaloticoccus capnophilus TaxID=1548208 RepID=A0A139SNR1_9BACT|nr:DoxX family protein [Cephaloticoccus capnophilus]KXU36227.1 hypothetical protein AXK12_03560 [Cephaloticoccus capnophilus]